MSDIIISLKNINKTYAKGKYNECHALKDFNYDIESGDYLAIMGRSGAGKSTLLHILAISENYEGTFLYNNEDVAQMTETRKCEIKNKEIGIVLQSYALINTYTVYDNVMIPLLFGKYIKPSVRKQMTMKALERVGMENYCKSKASKISGGQRQRVAIARALINNPKILLLDEPTGALDDETANDLMKVLDELNAEGVTIIMVTHDTEIANRAKHKIDLKNGELINKNNEILEKK